MTQVSDPAHGRTGNRTITLNKHKHLAPTNTTSLAAELFSRKGAVAAAAAATQCLQAGDHIDTFVQSHLLGVWAAVLLAQTPPAAGSVGAAGKTKSNPCFHSREE